MITLKSLYNTSLTDDDSLGRVDYDIWGIEHRLQELHGISYPQSLEMVLRFILTNTQMWHDVGNADLKTQAERFRGLQALYRNKEHTELNPLVNEGDYLLVFKEYMRKLASRKNEGSDEANWYRMQDELAEQIARWPHEIRKEEVA